jgi:signal transduction histidine kinase
VVTRLLRESTSRGALRLQISTQPMAPLVNQVLALRKPQAQRQGVHLSTGELSWTPFAFDHTLVRRSIENLVLNALQATSESGGEVRVTLLEEEDGLTILVEDTGPGVPDHLAAQIFDPNVTVGKPGGVGLGLALVKGVVEAHNGYVRCERSQLGGACFRAWIPAEQARSEESRDAHTPGHIPRIRSTLADPGGR